MRSLTGSAVFALVVLLSGCAGMGMTFGPGAPSARSVAFADRFPENHQGMVIMKPLDAGVVLDYTSSIWKSDAGSYRLRITDSKKSPYVILMLPPGEYALQKLDSYNYWMEIKKALVVVNQEPFIGKPGFEVKAGKVTYLGDVTAGSSAVPGTGGLFTQKKLITKIAVEDQHEAAAAYLQEEYPELAEYFETGLIAATGEVIKLGDKP